MKEKTDVLSPKFVTGKPKNTLNEKNEFDEYLLKYIKHLL
jgi:hypothetical protein